MNWEIVLKNIGNLEVRVLEIYKSIRSKSIGSRSKRILEY